MFTEAELMREATKDWLDKPKAISIEWERLIDWQAFEFIVKFSNGNIIRKKINYEDMPNITCLAHEQYVIDNIKKDIEKEYQEQWFKENIK